ncbi:hypothetical protein QD47_18655 [Paenibacillus terrae]|uniref:Uncharacterized protein n=1 Tax=Paenibacillus terrae TaxID=159743 RepID=A0A0D7WY68_9BACL|nr:hypothetical protein QD47_18655 [Paenibacillus terrae]
MQLFSGLQAIASGDDKTPLASFIDPLKKAKLTGEGLEASWMQIAATLKNCCPRILELRI